MDILTYCRKEKGTALFDMDGTLFDGDLGETLFILMLVASLMGKDPQDVCKQDIEELSLAGTAHKQELLRTYAEKIAAKDFANAYQCTTEYFTSIPYRIVSKTSHHAFREFTDPSLTLTLSSVPLEVYVQPRMDMLSYLHACQEGGNKVVIVSASPQAVLEAFCELYSLQDVLCLGAKGGIEDLPYGQGKIKALRENGIDRAYVAFGNSDGDRELLNFATKGILRSTGASEELLAYAKKQGWMLLP